MEHKQRMRMVDSKSLYNESLYNKSTSKRLVAHPAQRPYPVWNMQQLICNAAMQSFWVKFAALTAGQQQSFWLNLSRSSSLAQAGDLVHWLRVMERLGQIELRPNEPLREGDVARLGVQAPPYAGSFNGLLSPYRTLWQWLIYKGNKQGQQQLLRRLDQLSLPAKQLLLYRLANKAALSVSSLSASLTIKQHEQEWLDWARIKQQLQRLEALSEQHIQQQLEQTQQAADASRADHSMTEYDELEEEQLIENEGGAPWQALLTSGLTDSMKGEQEEQEKLFSALHDPEQLSRLLFNASLSTKQQVAPVSGRQLADRLLQVEHAVAGKRAGLREKRVKQLGFASIRDLLLLTIAALVEQFEQKARKQKDARYIALLRRMQLMQGNAMPGKQQLRQALQDQLLGAAQSQRQL